MANVLGTLPGASLGNTPGSSGARGSGKRRRPEQPGTQGAQTQPQTTNAPQTFAQMAQSGIARPAPPQAPIPQYQGSSQANQVRGDLQGAVNKALAAPSRYDTESFNTIRDSARSDLTNQFARIRSTTDENMARRGLAASSIAANEFRDVDSDERRALANIDSTLLQQAANTQAADRTAAYGMGSDLAGLAGSQDLAGYSANANTQNQNTQNRLAEILGLGNLNLQESSLTGNLNGQKTLGAQSLEQSGNQFSQQQKLAELLGLGNLDINKQQLSQSGSQFDKSLAQSGEQFNTQQKLAELLGLGNLDLQKQQLAQSGSQFDKQFGEQSRQFDTQQKLNELLGLGNLDLQRQGQANQVSQFGQDLGLRKESLAQDASQFDKNYGLQSDAQKAQQAQFQQQLAQALGIAQMGDNTANRGITSQEKAAQMDMLMKTLASSGSLPKDAQAALVAKIKALLG